MQKKRGEAMNEREYEEKDDERTKARKGKRMKKREV
jgi:hypothetical protein